jgi:hypothetical protein
MHQRVSQAIPLDKEATAHQCGNDDQKYARGLTSCLYGCPFFCEKI